MRFDGIFDNDDRLYVADTPEGNVYVTVVEGPCAVEALIDKDFAIRLAECILMLANDMLHGRNPEVYGDPRQVLFDSINHCNDVLSLYSASRYLGIRVVEGDRIARLAIWYEEAIRLADHIQSIT